MSIYVKITVVINRNIMARKRDRTVKSLLGQSTPEPVIEETKEEVVPAELLAPKLESVLPIEEPEVPVEKPVKEPIKLNDIQNLKEGLKHDDVEKTPPEDEKSVVNGITITKPSKEQLSRLSKAGLRWYQRTGMLPK